MTDRISETIGRVRRQPIRNIEFREPGCEWRGLSQKQWNVIKTWMCHEKTLDRELLLSSLQYEVGKLHDEVHRMMKRHGMERILSEAVMWADFNRHLLDQGAVFTPSGGNRV